MCLGFWVGFVNALIFFSTVVSDGTSIWVYGAMLMIFAIASSGVTWTLTAITQYALWAKCYYQQKSNFSCEDKK